MHVHHITNKRVSLILEQKKMDSKVITWLLLSKQITIIPISATNVACQVYKYNYNHHAIC